MLSKSSFLLRLILSVLCFLPALPAMAQPIMGQTLSKGYSSTEYKFAGSITQDDRGIIYFVSRPGVVTYDGVQFEKVGLKTNEVMSDIARGADGNIYVFGDQTFMKSYVDSVGQIQFKDLLKLLKNEVRVTRGGLLITSNRVYGRCSAGLLEYDPKKDSVNFYPGTFSSGFVKDDIVWLSTGGGKELLSFHNGKFMRAPYTDSLTNNNIPIRTVDMNFTNHERVLSLPSGLVAYSDKKKNLRILSTPYNAGNIQHYGVSIGNRFHFIGNQLTGAILIDSVGNLLNRYSVKTGLVSNVVIGTHADRESNIWVGLFGYKKNQLVKTEHGNDLRVWPVLGLITAMVKKGDKIYLSTSENLFVVDTKTNEMNPVFNEPHRAETVVNFRFGKEEHLLSIINPEGQIVEIDEKGKSTPIFTSASSIIMMTQSRSNPRRLYIVNDDKVSYLLYSAGKWTHYDLNIDFPTTDVLEDSDGSIWLRNPSRQKLLHLIPKNTDDVLTIKEQFPYSIDDVKIGSAPYLYPILMDDGELLFRCSLALLKFNRVTKKFETWNYLDHLGPFINVFKNTYNNSIYLQSSYKRGYEIFQVKVTNEKDTVIISKPFKRILPLLSIIGERAFVADEKSVWFVGREGYLVRYTESEDIKNYSSPFNTIIRKVTLNDSVLYGGYFTGDELKQLKPKLLYDSGRLTIRFAAPFYDNEEQTLYSYKMQGLDKSWSQWQRITEKEYQNLSEGDYTFLVKAKNIYGDESEPASFSFAVLPPWYRTWWAYALYIVLFSLFVIALIRWRTRSLQRKKVELEKTVELKTQELKEANFQLVNYNHELESFQEELRQSNDQLVATNEYLQKAQRQLVESEKMASLGQLTAGIAHEINNPINFISGGVQAINAVTEEFLEKKERTPEMLEATIRDIQDLMGSINNGVTRTATIITGLKNFANPSEEINDAIDVIECIENSVILMKRKMADHNIGLETNYHHHSRIPANSTQISQVVINLIDNAIHALKDINGARKITITTLEQADELLIKVKDNGVGIAEKDQSRIFEPFYTTKEVGSGVGLGLSISFSIIERHKGKLTFVSQSGVGTEFTISLPLSR